MQDSAFGPPSIVSILLGVGDGTFKQPSYASPEDLRARVREWEAEGFPLRRAFNV
jgi:hypothetical protein